MFSCFFRFLTWHWKCFQKENRKQNTQYFCSWCANNIFGTVIFLAFFWIIKPYWDWIKMSSFIRAKFDSLRPCSLNFPNMHLNDKFAKQQKYQTMPQQWTTFCPVLCQISPLSGWKITSWIMHLENKWYCFSVVLVNISFIIQTATQILLVKCYNNTLVSFSSSDQSLLITIIHKPKVGLPQNWIIPSVD